VCSPSYVLQATAADSPSLPLFLPPLQNFDQTVGSSFRRPCCSDATPDFVSSTSQNADQEVRSSRLPPSTDAQSAPCLLSHSLPEHRKLRQDGALCLLRAFVCAHSLTFLWVYFLDHSTSSSSIRRCAECSATSFCHRSLLVPHLQNFDTVDTQVRHSSPSIVPQLLIRFPCFSAELRQHGARGLLHPFHRCSLMLVELIAFSLRSFAERCQPEL
jgi:hypothetical protein